ncbi:hypothetical protein BDA99DRAFT_311692 [Phascolomyces articulosus]|uniref:Uncharacterized protein n=1 Tax=Phascolomyces articulosus TaxID=60185 RepID=A0AAD5JZH5_9FUNG|nr:hypothetical protein BDA99DRAFT_311692 [Phascolomyces articulosus]
MLTELGQYVDNDDDKEKKKSTQSHDNAAGSEEQKTQTFENYIKSLDIDYKPYINNNRDTETDVVTHKNSAEDDDMEIPATSSEHPNDKYFSNVDHRTHGNAHLNAELDQLFEHHKEKGEHDNSPLFQGTGGAQNVQVPNTGGDEDWVVDELPAPINQWFDESDTIKDHSNEGQWIAEEVDPSSVMAHPNGGWESETSDDEPKAPFDHTDIGTWIAQEIEDIPEKQSSSTTTTEHVDDASTEEWIAEEDAAIHRNEDDDGLYDHSDIGHWQAEEIEFDRDNVAWQYSHANALGNEEGWQEESEPKHPNVAEGTWHEESSHPDKVVNGWQEQESKHPNKVVNGWQEQEIQAS